MRLSIDPSTAVLTLLAVAVAIVAYFKDPSLPWIGARNGVHMLWSILPRMAPALILAGLLQVVIPPDLVARHFGRESGLKAIVIASVVGMLTPGGPMVSVPLLVTLANSGAGLAPMVAYMTSWSLFGMQRIISWEAPLMGWSFVGARVLSSFAFPVLAGWLTSLFRHD
jgi:uncharacterized membrane protein YraQ (UPF0718 family)